ncbi:MAG: Polyketide cyclase / dehydrase and lipid transport [Solirubrobacterales bacterium]|jgi:uncharacterized protein YndB with AHSA1/START domain|nr:Polyketide cyclase / dehydrase and lipid transport [Solirubrobacterales bacterium]
MCRQQAFIEAPVPVVWKLIADIENHPQWWPRVVEIQCEGLDEGCTYRQITQTPFGKDEMNLLIEDRDDPRRLHVRCLNTGTFVRFDLTSAQGGTFADGEMGMDPDRLKFKVFDATVGRRYFASWLEATMVALGDVAKGRAEESRGGR